MTKKLSLCSIDHFVLTVKDVERSVRFYSERLGCTVVRFAENRFAVQIGSSKINFHQSDRPIKPHASVPTSGSADFCLLAPLKATEIENYLKSQQIDIELGPVDRTGATGAITSFYFRDPDGNLIKIATTEKD